MRNWSSHEFGKRGGTLEEETQKFKGLQEAYESHLPTLEELLSKLELGLEDKAAWAGKSEVTTRRNDEDLPEYTKDTMAVQLEIAAAHEKLEAKRKQNETNTAAQLARIKNGGDAWEREEWVVADAGEEWASDLRNFRLRSRAPTPTKTCGAQHQIPTTILWTVTTTSRLHRRTTTTTPGTIPGLKTTLTPRV